QPRRRFRAARGGEPAQARQPAVFHQREGRPAVNGALAVSRYTLLELSRRRVLLVFFVIGAVGIALLGIGLKLLYQVLSSNPNSLGVNNNSGPAAFNSFIELLFVTYLVQAVSIFALLLAYGTGMTAIYHDLESGSAGVI